MSIFDLDLCPLCRVVIVTKQKRVSMVTIFTIVSMEMIGQVSVYDRVNGHMGLQYPLQRSQPGP